jgi:hypothetical protein
LPIPICGIVNSSTKFLSAINLKSKTSLRY